MIKEAYVSFEVAKLLKEKGFITPCDWLYCSNGYFGHRNSLWDKEMFPAPTNQMAMRWLREVHNLWIDIDPLTNHKWTWSIWFMNDPKFKMGESSQVISTYEDTIEAALKYALENLI